MRVNEGGATVNARGILLAATLWAALSWVASPAFACTGDCNGNGTVSIDELVNGVGLTLAGEADGCPLYDRNSNGQVDVDELLHGVSSALDGCAPPVIKTLVGTGLPGFNGDGLVLANTILYSPQDMTFAPDGTLYVVDWNNHRIRSLADDTCTTVAGTGEIGEGRDGEAIYVQFNHPTNVTFDSQGRMLIAAWHNSLVKRVDFTTGLAENIAGTGARAFGGDGGPANEARLDLPSSVVIDSQGNIIISDQANFRLRKIDQAGIITTICGTGTAGYSGDGGPAAAAQISSPRGQFAVPAGRIDIDAQDRIYIADTGNHVIRLIDTDGNISTIAGTGVAGYEGDGGPAIEAQLNTPSDVDVTANGTIYIADTNNNVVRKIAPDGTISTYAGTGEAEFDGDGGPAAEAKLDRPFGIETAANGDVYVADTHNQRLRVIADVPPGSVPTPAPTPTPAIIPCTGEVGSICTYAGTGETAFNDNGRDRLRTALYWPIDIEFTPKGRRIVLDWNNHRVREIQSDETFTTICGSDELGDGPFDLSDLTAEGALPLTVNLNHPVDVQEFSNGDIMFMAWHNHKVRVIDVDTGRVRVIMGAGAAFVGDGGPAKDARVNQPPHGVLDPNGNLFMIDQRNQRIRVVYNFDAERENAIVQTVAGTGVKGFNGDGIALQTDLSFPAGGNPEPSGGLALDPQGRLYFSDTHNHRIRVIDFSKPDFTEGTVTTIAGTGQAGYNGDGGLATEAQINFPEDIEVGPDGNIYFADTNNNRVRMINLTDGTIQTVAGTGEEGYSGDAGPASEAQLNRPFGVAFDQNGDLYISDTFNSRVRKVEQ